MDESGGPTAVEVDRAFERRPSQATATIDSSEIPSAARG
jgi:hypothetical protein